MDLKRYSIIVSIDEYSFLFILLFILCIPYNAAFGVLNTFVRITSAFSAAICLYYILRDEYYTDGSLMLLIGLLFWEILTTAINTGSVYLILVRNLPLFSTACLAYILIKGKGQRAIEGISTMFMLIMILQYISYITHFLGLSGDQAIVNRYNYYLGIRVNINKIILFSIFLALWNVKVDRFKGLIKLAIVLFTGIVFIIGESVSTSIAGVFIYAIMLIFPHIIRSKRVWRSIMIFFVAGVILFAFIGRSAYFNRIITDLLDESITMSGRTQLWEQAIKNITGITWLIGRGYGNGLYFSLGSAFKTTMAHNQYLSTILNYGLIGMFFFVMLYIKQIRYSVQDNINHNLLASIVAMLLIQIPASTDDMVYFYIFYIVSLNTNVYDNQSYDALQVDSAQ